MFPSQGKGYYTVSVFMKLEKEKQHINHLLQEMLVM